VAPELDRRRAVFVLGKIDEILSWEKVKEQEKDVRFVELGEYLCEVRAKQYWRLEKLKSFDEFLARRFPDSRRKAYYLMTIHEHLTRIPKPQLREMGWTKARELVKVARRDGPEFACAPWVHKPRNCPRNNSNEKWTGISRGKTRSPGKLSTSSFTTVSCRWWRKPWKPPA
jgi:hypothetical protein